LGPRGRPYGSRNDPHSATPHRSQRHRCLHGVQSSTFAHRRRPSQRRVWFWRESGKFIFFKCKAVVLATGGGGKAWKVTSNSWEYTGDGVTMALDAGADLMDMEFIQFHPTGMVWPPSVRGILVTEGVRGD